MNYNSVIALQLSATLKENEEMKGKIKETLQKLKEKEDMGQSLEREMKVGYLVLT